VRIHGQEVAVRCPTLQIHGLSGHADRDELLRWVESAPGPPQLVFLVHGEPESAAALGAAVHEKYGCRTVIPELGEHFDVLEMLA